MWIFIGETEQTTAVSPRASNTRSLRSRKNKEVGKKTVEKGLKPAAVSKRTYAELRAGSSTKMSLRSKTTQPTQQVRTRPSNTDSTKTSDRHRSEAAVQGSSTPAKSSTRRMPAVDSAGRSSSLMSPGSVANKQASSKTAIVQDGDRSNDNKSRSLLSSPMSTRSRSVILSSPEKSNRDRVPWLKKTSIVTYQNKHRVVATDSLQSTVSSPHTSATADTDSSPEKSSKTHTIVDGSRIPGRLESQASSSVSYSELRTVRSGTSPLKQHDVAVQTGSQSSVSSSCTLHHSNLHSTESLSTGMTSTFHDNVVMKSSGTTSITTQSSQQYLSCFESASSHTDDIDDDEIDLLARLAHGSPQSAVVSRFTEDRNVANRTPKKSNCSREMRPSVMPAKQTQHASTFGRAKSHALDPRQNAAADNVLDGSLESDGAISPKRRRTKADRKDDTDLAPALTRRATSQLAAGNGKMTKSAASKDSVAAALSRRHGKVDRSTRSGAEVTTSWVEKSSVEPVAGPSELASRTHSQNERSHASGKFVT